MTERTDLLVDGEEAVVDVTDDVEILGAAIDPAEQSAEAPDRTATKSERITAMAKTATDGAVSLARIRRERRSVPRLTPVGVRTLTAVDLARAEAAVVGTTPVASELLAEAAHSAERGEIARAVELLGGARRQGVARLGRSDVIELARALAVDSSDPEVAEQLLAEADRAEGSRGKLEPIRAVVRSELSQSAALEARASERTAARVTSVLGAARVGLVLAVLGAVAAWLGVVDAGEGDALRNLNNYASVVAWGGMGVVLSLVLPFGRQDDDSTTGFLRPSTELGCRFVLGITCAVAVVVVLQSGVQEVLDLTEAKAYPFAIAAGFGERLLDRRLAPEAS